MRGTASWPSVPLQTASMSCNSAAHLLSVHGLLARRPFGGRRPCLGRLRGPRRYTVGQSAGRLFHSFRQSLRSSSQAVPAWERNRRSHAKSPPARPRAGGFVGLRLLQSGHLHWPDRGSDGLPSFTHYVTSNTSEIVAAFRLAVPGVTGLAQAHHPVTCQSQALHDRSRSTSGLRTVPEPFLTVLGPVTQNRAAYLVGRPSRERQPYLGCLQDHVEDLYIAYRSSPLSPRTLDRVLTVHGGHALAALQYRPSSVGTQWNSVRTFGTVGTTNTARPRPLAGPEPA